MGVTIDIPIGKKLCERIKPFAKDEGVQLRQWIREVLVDHLDLLEKYTPPPTEGRRKNSRRDRK